ncbi:aminotransferase class I/II-fold pyridoxal phosphate-dependent enzyme [Alicyclobacillus tolerans]|uniref:aminotransferase class I/II-fold pyridoxal phosphate-dependent enzyme n=1 Tax=Alicyclobacillus tolerans TaxID=90970 RepID=UPI001EFFB68B|nr:aminotransferase class I/II-fold pyridoxal phosphate-dependent enzyme [Alicyclobacillus tolerans]MCF8566277.1 aminotransferase class I/II-fold pyridoxal phosphate-dependent enzyme [Alicyclobacillus tolerans]
MLEEMPVLASLIRHVQKSKLPLHVPGHKQGRILPAELGQWLGPAAKLDLTELPGLDNLQQPEGCIAQSQALAASHYGSDYCLYSVNGSSAAVMAAITAVSGPGHKVLFLNPFHQSAWRGLVFSGALPVFSSVGFNEVNLCFDPPGVQHVEAALKRNPDVRAVYLTSPTYTGQVAEVKSIANAVHEFGIPLVVDEAHGPHFGLAPGLPVHSVQAGADVVVHSVHKMLPGLTQAAWVHGQGPRVTRAALSESLKMLQTTSPSYLLMASLDAAQAWLRTFGAQFARSALQSLSGLDWGKPCAASPVTDPLRHFIPTGDLDASRKLQSLFETRGVYVEYADFMGVLSIFGLAARDRDVALYRSILCDWLSDNAQTGAMPKRSLSEEAKQVLNLAQRAQEPTLEVSPRDAYFAPQTKVPVEVCEGRVCAQTITPYPPGVPLLWPGQRIDSEAVRGLKILQTGRYEVHGIEADGTIPVLVGH